MFYNEQFYMKATGVFRQFKNIVPCIKLDHRKHQQIKVHLKIHINNILKDSLDIYIHNCIIF